MTTVVAIRAKEHIVMAADCRTTYDNLPIDTSEPKLVHCGAWDVGFAGVTSLVQAASRYYRDHADDLVYLPSFLHALHKHLVDTAFLRPHSNDAETEASHIETLLAGPTGLFLITQDRAVLPFPPGEFFAIGSGARYALGALALGMLAVENTDMDPEVLTKMATTAVNVASRFDPYTSPCQSHSVTACPSQGQVSAAA